MTTNFLLPVLNVQCITKECRKPRLILFPQQMIEVIYLNSARVPCHWATCMSAYYLPAAE